MVFSNNLLLGAGGQSTGPTPFDTTLIGNSVWLDGSADFLKRDNFTLSADGKKEFIFSMWIQRNEFGREQTHFDLIPTGHTSYNDGTHFIFAGDDQLAFSVATGGASGGEKISTAMYRDIGWYHVLVSYNTNASITATSRHRVFINGLEITDTSAYTAPPDNQSCIGGGTGNADLRIGKTDHSGIPYPANAYFTQACYLEGKSFQAGDYAITDFLDSFTFGTNGSQFVPKADADIAALASTVGGNSFCLDFANSADLGNDISSNNNDFTPTSMTSTNQSTNTPSLQFPLLNALNGDATLVAALEYGNRLGVGVSNWDSVFATKSMGTTGKYYYEVRVHTETGSNGFPAGIHEEGTTSKNWANYIGNTTATYGLGYALYSATSFYTNNSETSLGSALSSGDIVNMAVDLDNNKLFWGLNGVYYSSGNPSTGANPTTTIQADTEYVFGMSPSASEDYFVNFGQDSTFGGTTTAGGNTDTNGVGNFKYTVPTGFQCLASSSLSAPSYQGIDYFAPTLYEGNGTGQRVGDFVPFTDAFNVANSAMFQHDEARALSRTAGAPSSSGGKKGTWSTWYKTANIDTDNIFFDNGTTATNRFSLQMDASGQIVFMFAGTTILMTNADLKGGGLWRNLVLKVDTSLATASARAIMYIDGVEVTSFATDARASLTQDGELGYMDSGATQFVGSYNGVTTNQWDGYLAETIFLDNQFLSADSFGQLDTSTNKWVPKAISGLTLGDQGFYLAYGGNFGTGNGAGDSTGNSNNLTEIGTWTSADKFVDTPTKNFDNLGGASSGSPTISEGNTLATIAAGGKQIRSNFNLSSGKWYVEVDVQATNNSASMGLVPSRSATWANGPGRDANGGISYETDGDVYSDNVQDATAEASFAAGDVIQMAIDMNVKKVWFGKNNTFGGNPSAGTGGYFLPGSILSDGAALITLGGYSGSQAATMQINYGQFLVFDGGSTTNGFKYTPPTNFNAVNQDNLDDTQSKLTAFAWIKNRDATDNHMLFDKVRGVGNDLHSNDTAIEVANANTVQRFLQRGVQVGSDVEVNTAAESYVLWQWANDGTRTANTSGAKNIFETVSTPGHFAIFDWDGNSTAGAFQHNMGGAIEMIIVKRLNVGVWNWYVWHKAIPDTKAYLLDTNDSGHTSTYWNDVAVNAANQFTLGATEGINATGDEIISYAFRSVPGVCKVGSYIGNGNNDGPYISVGFLPRYILVRSTSGTRNWNILDTARNPVNIASPSVLLANTTAVDTAGQVGAFDILSDGFKPRDTALNTNGSGETYLYMAMADIGGNGTLPPVYGQ